MSDPRLWMAQVYRAVKDAPTREAFTQDINNCEGPDDAIAICKRYLALAPTR
jgi:hypothetical protein